MVRMFEKARSKAKNLYRGSARESSTATASVASSVPPQPAPGSLVELPPKESTEIETSPWNNLQERIWSRAYDGLQEKESTIVRGFENTVSLALEQVGTSVEHEAVDRNEQKATTRQEIRSRQMRKLVEKGLDRTEKGASIKQDIDGSLQAVRAIRGIMDRAVHAAPEAAVVWATVCLGLEILSNPVTEALENRKGIQYVLSRMEWYWKLVDLLLDENKGETSTAALRDELEKDIVRLFEHLLLYQMRSICLYHRSGAAVIARDVLCIDDWAGQLSSIKAAEEAVQRDMEQYNTQQANIRLQKLNVTASAMENNLQNIFAALQYQTQHHTRREEEEKDKQCLRDVRVTDPRTDKQDIEEKKGGLLQDSYAWICDHADFQRFRNDEANRLFWIKGDPGKGKTMLLCGIIDELERDSSASPSYFFCQAAGGDRYSTATSVLRGLIFDMARNNTHLIKYIREKYDYAGGELFSSACAWQDLSEILRSMLQDPSLANAVVVVDALDECSVDRDRLLGFISKPSPTKWIVSSRNWLDIAEALGDSEQTVVLDLEQQEDSISRAVDSYIKYKTEDLSHKKKYDGQMKDAVLRYLTANANGTFLWVALVCHELSKPDVRKRHTSGTLESFPPGLVPLYERMLSEISQSQDARLCKEILATVTVAYRPITVEELQVLLKALEDLDKDEIEEVIHSCGSFLTLRNGSVSFVHQSAKDYLLKAGSDTVVPLGVGHQHRTVFSRSLDLLFATLHRDMYSLKDPGYSIDEVSAPENDPLVAIQYSCSFWARHLSDWISPTDTPGNILDITGNILDFFQKKYLYWLEALSLMRIVSLGVQSIETLEYLLENTNLQHLLDIVHDARRFLLAYKAVIEMAPLQTYVSALIFSPTNSLIRQSFRQEEPDWITLQPRVETDWTACFQTLEGHSSEVTSVVFTSDGQRLASGAVDATINVWDVALGVCITTLRGHDMAVQSIAFSTDGTWLASGSEDTTIRIWDTTSATCSRTLRGHHREVSLVAFSNDDKRLLSRSYDETIKIWSRTSGTCLQTLEGYWSRIFSAVFSNDGLRLVSGSRDGTIKISDMTSATTTAAAATTTTTSSSSSKVIYTQDLEDYKSTVISAVFSDDGQRLALVGGDRTVKVWDATSGECMMSLEGHDSLIYSVSFSNDGQRMASGSERTVKTWDLTSSACTQTLEGHDFRVGAVALSHDGRRMASGSFDSTVKIWDTTPRTGGGTQDGHGHLLRSVVLSDDNRRLACLAYETTIQTWDATSGKYLKTLRGHNKSVSSIMFSKDSQQLVSGSWDKTIKIWDATTGVCLQTLADHKGGVRGVVLSNDVRLASASQDHTVKIWNTTSGICTQTLKGHTAGVVTVVFSNSGLLLASESDPSGSLDSSSSLVKTIKIWELASGFCLQTLEGGDWANAAMAFSNDDRRFVSCAKCALKIWDTSSGMCVHTLSLDFTIRCLSFDPTDDSCLFTNRGALRLGTSISTLPGDEDLLYFPRFDGYNLGDHDWIMHADRRLVWLPPGKRPHWASLVAGSKVVLGCGSHRVMVIGFDPTSLPDIPATF